MAVLVRASSNLTDRSTDFKFMLHEREEDMNLQKEVF
jgi:hypothetical protein